ncbi:MAG: hypothetical protein O2888_02475, partial [Chloroflexi bacterium]|nr:hypothetical protein [Chloroflexota bacterium]
ERAPHPCRPHHAGHITPTWSARCLVLVVLAAFDVIRVVEHPDGLRLLSQRAWRRDHTREHPVGRLRLLKQDADVIRLGRQRLEIRS